MKREDIPWEDSILRCVESEVEFAGELRGYCSKICEAKWKCRNCIYLKKICNDCGWETTQLKGIKICEKCGNKLEYNYKRINKL